MIKFKKGQNQKSKILSANPKRGQEEMVGFIVIIVMVSVAMLILLWFMLNNPSEEAVENFEVGSFVQAMLQYTTSCESQVDFYSVQDLIIACEDGEKCLDETDSCEALNETIRGMIRSAWNVSEQSAVRGYKLSIIVDDEEKNQVKEGNETTSYVGGFEDFARSGSDYKVALSVYY